MNLFRGRLFERELAMCWKFITPTMTKLELLIILIFMVHLLLYLLLLLMRSLLGVTGPGGGAALTLAEKGEEK